jgi:GNAT superfamily N-acetyltransferase
MTLTAQIEEYADCIEELKPLFPAHWEELGVFKDKMPLDPIYEMYELRAAHGELIMPTLRENGRIIGYWPTFVAPGLHYRTTLTATMDILYIAPERRGDGSGRLLFECLKSELQRRGVKCWYAGSKNHKQIEWFLHGMGFEPIEMHFAMWLGG